MNMQIIEILLYLLAPVVLSIPTGVYISKVMNGEPVFMSGLILPFEKGLTKFFRLDDEMNWKTYLKSFLCFSLAGFLILFLMEMLQGVLPLNPGAIAGLSWHEAFNNAASFVTNTNWQSAPAESSTSFFTNIFGLTVQNFISAAAGIAILFALIRGFSQKLCANIGNFWQDILRIFLYILLPLSFLFSILLVSQGVVQTFHSEQTVELLEPISLPSGETITEQVLPLGPVASQTAIKQLGTNGGGFYSVNAAHPFENPTPFSNFLEMCAILLIPMALCFTFGRSLKNRRQGFTVFIVMLTLLIAAVSLNFLSERSFLLQNAEGNTMVQAGNLEGKETRFGIAASSVWSVFTTAASNGSVNSMHDSYTPMGGMVQMILMQLGEVVFGGVGSGLIGMIGFMILTVFISGLMVGRTPELLGKKIEPFEMKMAVLICLAAPLLTLAGSGIGVNLSELTDSAVEGPHGFSQILYAFSSTGANNGSAFAGLESGNVLMNCLSAVMMLAARFIPLCACIALAGSLSQKKMTAASAGTLSTTGGTFIFLLILIVILIGALSFFPALSLGPIAEFLQGQ